MSYELQFVINYTLVVFRLGILIWLVYNLGVKITYLPVSDTFVFNVSIWY